MISLLARRVRVLEVYEDGEEARHFSFQILYPQPADLAIIPGQFFMLALPGFAEEAFTYASLPDAEGRFCALICRMGGLTAALFKKRPGDVLGYHGPYGQGWPLFFKAQRVLAVAGGSALAALATLIDEALKQHTPAQLSVIYGARHAAAQVLGRERERWKRALPFSETLDSNSGDGLQGSLLAQFATLFASAPPQAVLCSGSEPLMMATAEECLKRGMRPWSIWLYAEQRLFPSLGQRRQCPLDDSHPGLAGPTYRYDRYLELLAKAGAQPEARAAHSAYAEPRSMGRNQRKPRESGA